MNENLKNYIEVNIISQYNTFDAAHNLEHVTAVINNSLEIAKDYDVNIEMVYTIAAYHDVGIKYGRADHEITSASELINDTFICNYFSKEQLDIMQQAIKDHRASSTTPPVSIYGAIISEADRDISFKVILTRTIQYGIHHHPNFSKQEHYARTIEHITDKYGKNGYLKLWLNTKRNSQNLSEIHYYLENEALFKAEYDKIFDSIQS